jgi:integrase
LWLPQAGRQLFSWPARSGLLPRGRPSRPRGHLAEVARAIGMPKLADESHVLLATSAMEYPRRGTGRLGLLNGTHAWSWKAVKAAAGVDCRWHDLRHFCATQLLELGLDHFAISIQLGHTDGGALVMERYGHPSVDAAKRRLLQAFQLDEAETGRATGSATG